MRGSACPRVDLVLFALVLLTLDLNLSMCSHHLGCRMRAEAFILQRRLFSRRVENFSRASALHGSTETDSQNGREPKIGIVGGGLAGLSVAFHINRKSCGAHISIFDKALPGKGGASSVAGGLLHPLTPKGKLVHLGLEGITATNVLLDAAKQFNDSCILTDEIYRVATNPQHISTLQETAERLPELSEWIQADDLPWRPVDGVLGALRLRSGCRVVHMPSYLAGLWEAIETYGSGKKEWFLTECTEIGSPQFEAFDAVVLCAGSGLFHDSIVDQEYPIQLVRGQSAEITLNNIGLRNAMLSGKYVSPLLEPNRVLVGATHEFKEQPLGADEVVEELRSRSDQFAFDLWEDGTVDRITCGFRVQSNRGQYGRIPIVGQIHSGLHRNTWIYTGLSSRGLLHHGIFGEMLASKILGLQSEHRHPDLDWWQKR